MNRKSAYNQMTIKRQDDVMCEAKAPSTWQGFVFTIGLAIATGYGIVHFLIPLIAR